MESSWALNSHTLNLGFCRIDSTFSTACQPVVISKRKGDNSSKVFRDPQKGGFLYLVQN